MLITSDTDADAVEAILTTSDFDQVKAMLSTIDRHR